MILHVKQRQVFENINAYNKNLKELAANVTMTEKAGFKGWINCHGVARLTVQLGMESRIPTKSTIPNSIVIHRYTLWLLSSQLLGMID